MTDTEKLAKIEHYRKMLEYCIKTEMGMDATVSVALHSARFSDYAAGCALGWDAEMLDKSGTLYTHSRPRPDDIGDTTVYYCAGSKY